MLLLTAIVGVALANLMFDLSAFTPSANDRDALGYGSGR
jgi:hypothetical protein